MAIDPVTGQEIEEDEEVTTQAPDPAVPLQPGDQPAGSPAEPAHPVATDPEAPEAGQPLGGDEAVQIPSTEVPPPPPVVPPPPGTQGGLGGLQDYAAQWMNAPSRYDIDVVQQGMESIRNAMGEVRRRGMQSTEADLARRGLNVSTMGQETADIARAGYDRQEQTALFNLMREQAMTAGADRASAFGAGLGAEGLAEGSRQFTRGLESREMMQGRDISSREGMFGQEMGQRQREFDMGFGENQRQFDQMQTMERERMQMSDEQFQQSFGLSKDQFDEQKRQFDEDSGMRERAMDLQQQGMDADEAWRQAQMDFQRDQFGFTQEQAQQNRNMELFQMMGGTEGFEEEDFLRWADTFGFGSDTRGGLSGRSSTGNNYDWTRYNAGGGSGGRTGQGQH